MICCTVQNLAGLTRNAHELQLTSKRRVGIAEFKGVCMVNIREYYEKDGETLPGKKVCVEYGRFSRL